MRPSRRIRLVSRDVLREIRRLEGRTGYAIDIKLNEVWQGKARRDIWDLFDMWVDQGSLSGAVSYAAKRKPGPIRFQFIGYRGRHRMKVSLRDVELEVIPKHVLYVGVVPPHGVLRPRTTRAPWLIAQLDEDLVQEMSSVRWPRRPKLPERFLVEWHGDRL